MNSNDPNKKPEPGSEYEIPAEGSLGLLALGARGIDLWRKKRNAVKNNSSASPENSDEKK